jgi:LicD family
MAHLYVFRRRDAPDGGDLLLAREPAEPDGWRRRQALDVSWEPEADALPYFAWERHVPRPGHVITTGNLPRDEGDWSLHLTFYASSLDPLLPVEEVPRPRVPAETELLLVKPLFLDLLDLLNRHDFPYWAESGTLLGAIRHRGMIPWDKDCDLGILRRDRKALVQLLRAPGSAFGVAFETRPIMWITSVKYDIRLTDVFTYTFRRRFHSTFWAANAARLGVDLNAGFLVYDHPVFSRYQDQRFNVPWSLFHPVRFAPFYDRRIKVPGRPQALLHGQYGDDCLTHASVNGMDSRGARLQSFEPL